MGLGTMIDYIPLIKSNPRLATQKKSAWGEIPFALSDIIIRAKIERNWALEFGCEYGYSTSALANYFQSVVGVDTFKGDINSGIRPSYYEETKGYLADFPNITLVQQDYKEFIENNNNLYDLIHIDIVHTYEDTYKCGEWSLRHADVVLFHDTMINEVRLACYDLASQKGLNFYNYQPSYGLGILTKREL